jgi:hypothetical protein
MFMAHVDTQEHFCTMRCAVRYAVRDARKREARLEAKGAIIRGYAK